MNIVATNGSVHAAAGEKRTKCSAKIRSAWQPTDAPLTCQRCQLLTVDQSIVSPAIAAMLSQLDCSIADELLVIQVLPDVSGAVVTVRKADLRAWCEKRIEARKSHVNKCLRGGSGPPSLGVIRTAY